MRAETIDDSETTITFTMPPSYEEKHSVYFEKRSYTEIKCDDCGMTRLRSEMRYDSKRIVWVCFEHYNVCVMCSKSYPLDNLTVVENGFYPTKVCKSCLKYANTSSNLLKSRKVV